MLVTNETAFCFVLAAGVIIQPNAASFNVSDTLYQSDSTLNAQLDALQAQNLISISGKPTDTFPEAPSFTPPVIIQAQNPGDSVIVIESADGQVVKPLAVFDATGVYGLAVGDGVQAGGISFGGDGASHVLLDLTFDRDGNQSMVTAATVGTRGGLTVASGDPGVATLDVYPDAAQTAPIFRVNDAAGNPVLAVNADGTVHIKTGGTIHADL